MLIYPDIKTNSLAVVLYRHPCNNYNAFFDSKNLIRQEVNSKDAKVMVFGDINIDLHSDLTKNACKT